MGYSLLCYLERHQPIVDVCELMYVEYGRQNFLMSVMLPSDAGQIQETLISLFICGLFLAFYAIWKVLRYAYGDQTVSHRDMKFGIGTVLHLSTVQTREMSTTGLIVAQQLWVISQEPQAIDTKFFILFSAHFLIEYKQKASRILPTYSLSQVINLFFFFCYSHKFLG